MRLVREILYIMNACEMFYDPSKSVLHMLKMLANAVANFTNVLRINMNAKHGYLSCIIHIAYVSYICQALYT